MQFESLNLYSKFQGQAEEETEKPYQADLMMQQSKRRKLNEVAVGKGSSDQIQQFFTIKREASKDKKPF